MNTEKDRLIKSLIADGYLKTPRIIDAFKKIDRADFIPKELYGEAYGNYPLPIGEGQTISQPLTVAFMIELLCGSPDAKGRGPDQCVGKKILDIGTGSGWTTALLASMAGPKGKIYGLEIVPELFEFGRKNLEKYNFKNLELNLSSGREGLPDKAPFDRILVSAAAEEIPKKLLQQLKTSGRIVIPVGQSIFAVDKISKKDYKTEEHPGFVFVPLIKD